MSLLLPGLLILFGGAALLGLAMLCIGWIAKGGEGYDPVARLYLDDEDS